MGILRLAAIGAVIYGAARIALRERPPARSAEPPELDLEDRLAVLEAQDAVDPDAFETALADRLAQAWDRGEGQVEISAGELHRAVGGYPGPENRMSDCCRAMRKALKTGDVIVREPKSGEGATLTLRYLRPAALQTGG